MYECEHLSGENRMFSAVHSDKRMARVTGTLYIVFSGLFRLNTPKSGQTKQERRNTFGFLGAIQPPVFKRNQSCAASLSLLTGVMT